MSEPKFSYCASHNTYPLDGEPCWQCANPHIQKAMEALEVERAALQQRVGVLEKALAEYYRQPRSGSMSIDSYRLAHDVAEALAAAQEQGGGRCGA